MSKWKECKFEDIAELRRESFDPTDNLILPYIGLEHIEQKNLRLIGVGSSEEVSSQKSKFYPKDILYGKLRPYFQKVYQPSFGGICSTDIYVIKAKDGINSRFLFYLVATDQFTSLANSGSTGTRMPRADWKFLSKTLWRIPPLPTQKAIAEILSSLDDKIELNNQINRNLEALAQTLFKRWFVDFEFPNEKGQPYKSSGGKMVDSELGPIPEGWEVGCIGDYAKNKRQTIHPEELDESTNYIGLEHIPQKSLWVQNWDHSDKVSSQKSQFSKGDILFGKLRPYFHKVVVSPIDGICSTDILVIQPKEAFHFGFLTMHLFSDRLVNYATQVSGGTRMPRVNWQSISDYNLSEPEPKLLTSFNELFTPMVQSAKKAVFENNSLISFRNTLLPRLISGELEVSEAEDLVTQAV
jgi:type I restriction enzyme S subunit